jgi:response regulator of citrate/malate metabolism
VGYKNKRQTVSQMAAISQRRIDQQNASATQQRSGSDFIQTGATETDVDPVVRQIADASKHFTNRKPPTGSCKVNRVVQHVIGSGPVWKPRGRR